MLFLLMLLPLGGMEFLVLPAIILTVGPQSWHLPLIVLSSVIVALAVVAMTLRMREGSVERRASLAEQAGWRWAPQMAPHQYRLRLVTFLQLHGWRITASTVNAHGRVEVIARKDRCFLALACVSPTQAVADADDLARLAALKAESGASHAVMVTLTARAATAPAAPASIMEIRFDDLATLDEAIGLQVGYFSAI